MELKKNETRFQHWKCEAYLNSELAITVILNTYYYFYLLKWLTYFFVVLFFLTLGFPLVSVPGEYFIFISFLLRFLIFFYDRSASLASVYFFTNSIYCTLNVHKVHFFRNVSWSTCSSQSNDFNPAASNSGLHVQTQNRLVFFFYPAS